jgi:hypothetical protein
MIIIEAAVNEIGPLLVARQQLISNGTITDDWQEYMVTNDILYETVYLANKHPANNGHLYDKFTDIPAHTPGNTDLRGEAQALANRILGVITTRTGTGPNDIFDGQDLTLGDSGDFTTGGYYIAPAARLKEERAQDIAKLLAATFPKDGTVDETYLQNVTSADINAVIDGVYTDILTEIDTLHGPNSADPKPQYELERIRRVAVEAAAGFLKYYRDNDLPATLTADDLTQAVKLRENNYMISPVGGVSACVYPTQGDADYIRYEKPLAQFLGLYISQNGPQPGNSEYIFPTDASNHSYDAHASIYEVMAVALSAVETYKYVDPNASWMNDGVDDGDAAEHLNIGFIGDSASQYGQTMQEAVYTEWDLWRRTNQATISVAVAENPNLFDLNYTPD